MTPEAIMADHPRLAPEDIRAAQTFAADYLADEGLRPGEKITVDKLPDGRIVVKTARPKGNISDVFNFLKRENGPSLSIEAMNKVIARGWAGKR
jgi:hypothetical protein